MIFEPRGLTMLHRSYFAGLLLPAVLLGGCSWTGDFFKSGKSSNADYKSESNVPVKAKSDVPTLELPPNLTTQTAAGTAASPDGRPGISKIELEKNPPSAEQIPSNVLPTVKNAHIVRDGSGRWLVISGKPDQYWDAIKEFWQEAGYVMSVDQPDAGLMETDWVERRAKVSQGAVRSILGNVVESLTSTAQRDKFRTRLEVNASGETEIYISHRGMSEVYRNNVQAGQTVWTARAPDPDLEAEYLRRLMLRLGNDESKPASGAAVAGKGGPKKSKIVREGTASAVELDETFDRAWRRVGLALDRVGFTVEDRDRAKGLYYVRYADSDATTQKKKAGGMFSGIKNWFDQDKTVVAEQYQIQVTTGAPATRVVVLSKTGAREDSQTSQHILSLLNEQLE
jgi:outer membrane protein assembly factor BamC